MWVDRKAEALRNRCFESEITSNLFFGSRCTLDFRYLKEWKKFDVLYKLLNWDVIIMG